MEDFAFDASPSSAPLAYFNITKRSGLLAGAGPVFWVIFCGIITIFAIALGTWVMVDSFRDRALQSSERELENTALLLARHFDRQIEDFESVQKSLAAQIEGQIQSPDQFKQLLSTEAVHRSLRDKINETSYFAGINLFDSDGAFINSSERWPIPSLTLSDRSYFKTLRSGRDKTPVLIELVDSRLSRGWTVVIARAIRNSNGAFLGMITRCIPPESFEKFFSSVVPPQGAIALLH